jgi:hypothetical protein
MKRILLLIVFGFVCSISFSQSQKEKEADEKLKSIEGQWKQAENGDLNYQSIVEVPGENKDELFLRATNFFIYKYKDINKGVLQTQDKEQGLVVAKAYWPDFYQCYGGFWAEYISYSAYFVLRVDIKDERARVTMTIQEYDFSVFSGKQSSVVPISAMYPLNTAKDKKTKPFDSMAFYELYTRCTGLIEELTVALKKGLILNSEDKNW